MLTLIIGFIISQLQQQSLPDTSNQPSPYLLGGIALSLVGLLVAVFKYFAADADKKNAAREERILQHNTLREQAYSETVYSLKNLITDLDRNWKSTADRMDHNYQNSIDKFIKVIDKVMDQNSYTTQVLVELKEKIEHYTKQNDVSAMKKEILDALSKINLEYNLTPKNRTQP